MNNAVRTLAFATGVVALAVSGWVAADPPSRVARLGYMTGAVSLSPAGEADWVVASINRPLTTGDRVWADAGARAEIQVGGALMRLDGSTGLSVLNLDDRMVQLQLTQGVMNVRVRRLDANQAFEIDTPNLAFAVRKPGDYRIDVDPDGNATTIVVRNGQGEVYGESASYVVDSRQAYRFTGTGLRDYQVVNAPRIDEFDRWAGDRDRIYDNSPSARYVSPDVVGYQDLDAHGAWRVDATYGNVWTPNRVDAGWAPYRDGHWAWVDPWGWTWVDDAPWGFAVSHYGRWANLGGTWGWIPGPVRSRAYYAPALVVFVGGDNFQIALSGGNVGGIGWFPLGPREVYRPWYPVSRGYFDNVNTSNTIVNTTVINNYYNNTNVTNVTYANRQVPGAVIAVPTTAFVQSQPVSRMAIRVTHEQMAAAPVVAVAPVAPTAQSVRGAAGPGTKPSGRAFDRPVVARTAPPAAPVGYAAQQQQLTANRGKPLDDVTRRQLAPAPSAQTPVVSVVAQPRAATVRPPPVASAAKPDDARSKPAARTAGDVPAAAPSASTRVPPPVTAAKPATTPGRPDRRDDADARKQTAAPAPATSPAAQPPDVPRATAP
ncbi:MAG TPA: DUF6600 domain-containing protein, partial [Vicinamibacterales bacterium]|nr:DUF6600 domain-containing protein [Vicinamibacterales bacterium]